MPDKIDRGSTTLYYVDDEGQKRDDGLFPTGPADKHAYGEDSMRRAMALGMTRQDAFDSCGPDGCTLAEHDAEMALRARRDDVSPSS